VSEKAKNKPSDFRKWSIRLFLLFLILVASFCLFLVFLLNALSKLEVFLEESPKFELGGQQAHDFIDGRLLPLPENASDVYLYYFFMQDHEAFIRFSASPQTVDAWIDSLDLCFDPISRTEQLYNSEGKILSWWQPTIDLPNTELESYRISGKVPVREISVDKRNTELWTIYIFMHKF
jgi:hypothetical protein